MQKYLTTDQAAEQLGCTRQTIYNYIKAGRLPARRPVHALMIAEEDLVAFIEGTEPLGKNTNLTAAPPVSKNNLSRADRKKNARR